MAGAWETQVCAQGHEQRAREDAPPGCLMCEVLAVDAAIKPRLMHQQRLDGKPDDLVSVDRRGEIKPATARERQLRLF